MARNVAFHLEGIGIYTDKKKDGESVGKEHSKVYGNWMHILGLDGLGT